jgi:hypothetical protein
MQVLITTAYTPPASAVPEFNAHAARDRFKVHRLTDDPEAADVILFVDARADQNDWQMRTIRRHEFVRRFPEKSFVFCEMDQPWCGLPGVYTSMPRESFDYRRQRACGYHILRLGEAMAKDSRQTKEPGLLFSFMGRSLPGAREAVLRLSHPRALIEDTTKFNFFTGNDQANLQAQEERYRSVILDSKFVLCPAGAGSSSIRLFETLGAGRVPVILSDEWVEVSGPDWRSCSVRVPENRINELPELLEAKEAQWPDMAACARQVWAEWFAPDVVFHRLIEACADIELHRRLPERVLQFKPSMRYARLWLRHLKSVGLGKIRKAGVTR